MITGGKMSMRGQIISKEYQKMVFVKDKDGKQYACNLNDLKNHEDGEQLTDKERKSCMDLNQVLGDSW